jgi:hypothetical protein
MDRTDKRGIRRPLTADPAKDLPVFGEFKEIAERREGRPIDLKKHW